jgi:predicted pyridoxine 5'-phosphate oxidase superfamily flavin-nucleotide-binding protein
MGKVVDSILPELQEFIRSQPIFFVASAPLAADGHVNLSPKGLDTLRVLDPRRVAYLDLTGSGNETAAHLVENGRITLLFCAFSGRPKILRLYGRGRVVVPSDPEWATHAARFAELPGTRQVIVVDVERVQTSCGFGVPEMTYVTDRDLLLSWADSRRDELPAYRARKNSVSIDGLPAPDPDAGRPPRQ